MLQERSRPWWAKQRAAPLSVWWRTSCVSARALIVTGALGISRHTNEPVWPAPGAPQVVLAQPL
jgi:hypothetical protein